METTKEQDFAVMLRWSEILSEVVYSVNLLALRIKESDQNSGLGRS